MDMENVNIVLTEITIPHFLIIMPEMISKRCISECPKNQVSYNNICFDNCLNASNFVTENINHSN